jgi:hypothetical protein
MARLNALVAVAVCSLAGSASADKANLHVAVAKVAPRVERGTLWIKYEVTPKKVMTDQALLIRAACTKATSSAPPMRDTATWPIQNNTLDAKELDNPFGKDIADPTSCQFEFHLVPDLLAMSGEHVATMCWDKGKVTDGACKPAIAETYAQGVEEICKLNARWDSKGADRDADLAKDLEDRVWNQQAKDFFAKLEKTSAATKRAAPLRAEAAKVGIKECALAKQFDDAK